jgi:DNA repair protein RecO (recombination protein O)
VICQTDGLVLRGFRMSESSKVVVLFSRDFGKVRLVAKGARRPKSKFGASTEPMTWGRYVFYKRENRDLQILTEGDIAHAFESVKRHYGRMAAGSAICESLDHMTEDEDRNPLLFSVVLESLQWVGAIAEADLDVPVWYFQIRAAGILGYRPHLSGCVQCGSRLEGQRLGFSPGLGGTLCAAHAGLGMAVRANTVDFMAHLQVGKPDRIDLTRLQGVERSEVPQILRAFLNQHIASRYKPKALDFFERLRAAEQPMPYQTGI